MKNIKSYQQLKNEARQKAIEWQLTTFNDENTVYYSDLAKSNTKFFRLAKKYGLIKEFKANGII